MYVAASSAAGSACLSRQVGAAIYNDGELIGKGRNDVPKANGGLYGHADGEGDHRCHKWLAKICHNDDRKSRLYKDVHNSLLGSGVIQKGTSLQSVIDVLKKTDIKNLIEYSRAVHAEMDAIMSVARTGNGKLLGATLYCTTFPCHNCARHIVASGITKVVYIEPYPKSLALDLHKDAISIREGDAERVVFVQYEGVAPKNMLRLFEYRSNRKKDGKAVTTDPKVASPVSRSPLDGYYRREQIIVHRLQHIEGAVAAEKGVPDDGKDEKGPAA
jgi:deoxycytidylate deaminase